MSARRPGLIVASLLLTCSVAIAAETSPPVTPAAAGAAISPLPAAMPADNSLWHLPASASALRITGELGTLEWPIYVPAKAASTLRRFQIGYRGSIAVMPEASGATLTINGQLIGRVPIASPSGIKTAVLDIPPGTLLPGWNAVSIDISQRHRVDCSVESTYELWTQIDPAQTGFVGGTPKIESLSDFPALPTESDGSTRIHLMLPKDPSPADLGRAVRVIERLAIASRFAHPVVDTTPGTTGLHVAVGPAAFLSTLPAPSPNGDTPRLTTTSTGAPLLVLPGLTDADLDRTSDALGLSTAAPAGTEEGLKALARASGLRLKPGGALTFADLGLGTLTFSGRLFRKSFDVLLPPDAYPADYAEARLALDGGYAGGLTREARMVVRVNGIIDGNLDFNRSGGAVLQGQVIHMPLDPFRPGRNHIEIEAQLPARADESCDTLNSIGGKERFLLLGTTTLSLPPLARVAQFPSISATMAGNLRLTPRTPPRLFVPRVTDGTVSAVATLLANTAASAGAPSGAIFVRGTPQSGADPAIVVGNSSDMPAVLLTSAGLDAQSVSIAWRAGARPLPLDAMAEATRPVRPPSDNARLDAWGERVDDGDSWLGGPGSVLNAIGGKFQRSLRGAGLLGDRERPMMVTGDTSFILAQGLAEETPLTLITARDDKALADGAAALTDPSRLASLDGRAASFEDGSAGTTLVAARDTAFFRTQPFSFINDRLVAAGWVSKHAGWYIGAALAAALLLGLSTWAVLTFGRRSVA